MIGSPPPGVRAGLARVIRYEPPRDPHVHYPPPTRTGVVGISGASVPPNPPDGAHFPVETFETGRVLWLLPLLENVTWSRATLLDLLVFDV